MKAESMFRPDDVNVEITGNGNCDVILCDNIEEITRAAEVEGEEEVTVYRYDSYRFPLVYRNNLSTAIRDNFADWVAYAAELENSPKELTDKEKIIMLMQQNASLISDNEILKADNELLKGCIMELADEVFA